MCELISRERENLQIAAFPSPSSESELSCASKAGLQYLDYLVSYWMPEEMWNSWSQKGRTVASILMGVPLEGIIPTTNHLESFNFVLKYKHIGRFKHSGHRLRFDVLIHLLITRILPEIYLLRHTQHNYASWLTERFRVAAGGADLVSIRSKAGPVERVTTAGILWWESDKKRDKEAREMAKVGRIVIARTNDNQFEATCASTSAIISDPSHLKYKLYLHRKGFGSCTCSDFQIRGGACKHLRTLRLYIDQWITSGKESTFYYPQTSSEAHLLSRPYASAPSPAEIVLAVGLELTDINPPLSATSALVNLVALQTLAGAEAGADHAEEISAQSDAHPSSDSWTSANGDNDEDAGPQMETRSSCLNCQVHRTQHFFVHDITLLRHNTGDQTPKWRNATTRTSIPSSEED